MSPGFLWALCGLAIPFLTAAAIHASRGLPDSLAAHLSLWLLAGGVWLAALMLGARAGRPTRRTVTWLWLCALLLRAPALCAPPRHSDDVFRYLWDGAVGHAGQNPFAAAPDDPRYAPIRQGFADFGRINHRELPTVYPPAAQLGFRLAAFGGPLLPGAAPQSLLAWKIVVAVADLLVLALVLQLCRRAGRSPRWAVFWAWSPLCAIELGQNAHMDVLGILPLCAACLLWPAAPPAAPPVAGPDRDAGDPGATGATAPPAAPPWRTAALAGALLAASILIKPLGAALLPATRGLPRRLLLALAFGAALAVSVTTLPFLITGPAWPGSIGEYSRRWRGNDGAFAALYAASAVAVERFYPPKAEIDGYAQPWSSPRLAHLISGRDRDAVWPDELANFLARAAALLLLTGFAAWLWFRPPQGLAGSPPALALALITAYLLLTPVLHPWYILWALALCPACPALAGPALALALLAPVAYLPLGDFLRSHGQGAWRPPAFAAPLQHGAAWLLLGLVALRAGKPARSPTSRRPKSN